jgi:hypothetical protein
VTDTRWWERAACKGCPTEWWFPAESRKGRKSNPDPRALAICAVCTVTQECFDDAIAHRDGHAIAGGTTPQQRCTCGDAYGTPAGYSRHLRRGELPCSACHRAKLDRNRDNAKKRGGWVVTPVRVPC